MAVRQASTAAKSAVVFALVAALGAQQTVDAPPAKKPNAADLYQLALREARTRFEVSKEDILPLQLEQDLPDDAQHFAQPEWAKAVERAGPAVDLFAQATRTRECSFGPGKDPTFTAFDEDRIQLHQLAQLVLARGWSRRAAEPARAAEDALTVLRYARHVFAEPSMSSELLACTAETRGLRLLAAVAPGLGADLAASRGGILEHERLRPSLPATAALHERTLLAVLDMALAGDGAAVGADGSEPLGAFLRTQQAAVRTRCAALLAEGLEPLHAEPPVPATDVAARTAKLAKQWRADASRKRLERDFAKLTDEQRANALAKMIAVMLLPDVGELAQHDEQARELLAECKRLLTADTGGR